MDIRNFFTKQTPNANPPKIEVVAITLVMPLLLRQTLQMPPMFLIYHLVILEAAYRHRLTVHRSAMQVQQMIRIQQSAAYICSNSSRFRYRESRQ